MVNKSNAQSDSGNKTLESRQSRRANERNCGTRGCCSVEPEETVSTFDCSQRYTQTSNRVETVDADAPYIIDFLETPVGKVPRISTTFKPSDHLGTFKARWGINRTNYRIAPGLYAVGNPNNNSEVLVTANYKMSFDHVRRVLDKRDIWILVLDTQGINVWCAAGKGTFGTHELIARIKANRLSDLVVHRRLVLPQLGAVGVAAHQVKRASGFKVVYGPIMAEDLPRYLDAGRHATPEMRRKRFPIQERAALIPIELVAAIKIVALMILAFFFLSGFRGELPYWQSALIYGSNTALALAGALVSGAILTPLLLPWIPGRAFALKGLVVGLILSPILVFIRLGSPFDLADLADKLEMVAWLLLIPSLSSFMAMNFTGASTYTSLSGVLKEMRLAIPAQVFSAGLGSILWCVTIFV